MSKEELRMEHEKLHYEVEKLESKKFLQARDLLVLKILKKKKLKIKDQLVLG